MSEYIKLSELKPNQQNPRKIGREALQRLIDSIKEFSQMMELRPIIIDENKRVLGGNQRLLALKAMKNSQELPPELEPLKKNLIPKSWVKQALHLSEYEKNRFILADNINAGKWDFDILFEQISITEAENLGIETPENLSEKQAVNLSEETPPDKPKKPEKQQLLICPHCGEEIQL